MLPYRISSCILVLTASNVLFFFLPKKSGDELHMLHSELESVRP